MFFISCNFDIEFMASGYVCYLLTAPDTCRTYIGSTNDEVRRLRQHNSEISGGARYTTMYSKKWAHTVVIGGFATRGEALKFEWAAKRAPDRKTVISGFKARANRMVEMAIAAELEVRTLRCSSIITPETLRPLGLSRWCDRKTSDSGDDQKKCKQAVGTDEAGDIGGEGQDRHGSEDETDSSKIQFPSIDRVTPIVVQERG